MGSPDLSRCGVLAANDEVWATLARAQHGVISRVQLRDCGLSADRIEQLVRRSMLVRQARGFYRAAPAQASFESTLWLAVLATGGVLSGTTASYLWGMLEQHTGPIRIIVPRHRRVSAPAGVRVLRRDVLRADCGKRYGLPVTQRSMAAIDHLTTLSLGDACAFADRALQRGWLYQHHMVKRLTSPQLGNQLLRRVMARLGDGAESESERLLHRLLRARGITGWIGNYPVLVGGVVRAQIDVAFVELRIAIEVDGFAYHSDRARFQRDRNRQNLESTEPAGRTGLDGSAVHLGRSARPAESRAGPNRSRDREEWRVTRQWPAQLSIFWPGEFLAWRGA